MEREDARRGACSRPARDCNRATKDLSRGLIGVEPQVRLTRLSRQICKPCGLGRLLPECARDAVVRVHRVGLARLDGVKQRLGLGQCDGMQVGHVHGGHVIHVQRPPVRRLQVRDQPHALDGAQPQNRPAVVEPEAHVAGHAAVLVEVPETDRRQPPHERARSHARRVQRPPRVERERSHTPSCVRSQSP